MDARQVEIAKYVKAYQELDHYGRPGDILREMIAGLFDRVDGNSLLDVSCGRGIAMEMARERFSIVKGTEVVPELIGGPVVYAEAHKLPFDDDSFDVVMSTGVMEHLLPEDTDAALSEMKRVTRKWVLITLNNDPSHWHINCPSYHTWDKKFRSIFSDVEYLKDMETGGKNRAWVCRG